MAGNEQEGVADLKLLVPLKALPASILGWADGLSAKYSLTRKAESNLLPLAVTTLRALLETQSAVDAWKLLENKVRRFTPEGKIRPSDRVSMIGMAELIFHARLNCETVQRVPSHGGDKKKRKQIIGQCKKLRMNLSSIAAKLICRDFV